MRQRAGAIAQQSRAATGVIVQKLDKNDGIKDVALVPEIDEPANASGSGAGGGVAEKLRGGGAGGRAVAGVAERHEDEVEEEQEGRTALTWVSSKVREILYPRPR